MRAGFRSAFAGTTLLFACNTIVGFDELQRGETGPDEPDRSPMGDDDDDTSGGEGGADTGGAPRCDPTKSFGSPAIVPELDGAENTRSGIMSPDEREIFYLRLDRPEPVLRHARRASRDATWDPPTTDELSPQAFQLGSLVAGGLKLYYWRPATGSERFASVLSATRQASGTFTTGNVFKSGSPVNNLTFVTANDDSAYWPDYFVDGGVDKIIFRGNVTTNGVIAGAEVKGVHNIPQSIDEFPVLDTSETNMYFASSRVGGRGSGDVWLSHRVSKQADWEAPMNVDGLNDTTRETPSWVSDDGCVILIDRSGHVLRAQKPL